VPTALCPPRCLRRDDPSAADPEDIEELATELDAADLGEPGHVGPEHRGAVAGDQLTHVGSSVEFMASITLFSAVRRAVDRLRGRLRDGLAVQGSRSCWAMCSAIAKEVT
jgi:hypothetical protein